jgi:hypothetical protein
MSMRCFNGALRRSFVFAFVLPALSPAQVVSISGTVVDMATLQGVPNAVVTLVESPSVKDTTDAYGNFALGGPTGVRSMPLTQEQGASILIRGDLLTLSNIPEGDATRVDAYNAAGAVTYHSRQTAGQGRVVSFSGLRHAPGLYYVKVRSNNRETILRGLGMGRNMSGSLSETGTTALRKSMATYSLSISKIGYATKQVSGINGSSSAETIKVQALPAPRPVIPMPVISQNVPAYSSGSLSGAGPTMANDTSQNSVWSSTGATGWLAYDLSSKPLAARQKVLVAWYDKNAMDYFFYNGSNMAKDYSIEINMAPGGGSAAPATGWITVFAVTGNQHSARQHEINMKGANWVRINVSASYTAPVTLDMDVYDISNGVTDFWLLMGDSITFMSMARSGNNLQNRVRQRKADAWPGIICAAEGGTSSWTGCQNIKDVLASFSGKFITLNYGTNDHPDMSFNGPNGGFFNRMDSLCAQIIAAGKTPVIPALPWPHTADSVDALVKLNQIHQIYAKYPTLVVQGPDLWAFFKNNPDLIAPGDVHPNSEGMEDIRQMWVAKMDSLYAKP